MIIILCVVIALLVLALAASVALTAYYKNLYMATDGLLQAEHQRALEISRESLDREIEKVFGDTDYENLKGG